MHIYQFFCKNTHLKNEAVKIKIQPDYSKKHDLKIRTHHVENLNLPTHIIEALGGRTNIETYKQIPNSNRIRLTVVNPKHIDTTFIEQTETSLFIRIGKRIIHIIP